MSENKQTQPRATSSAQGGRRWLCGSNIILIMMAVMFALFCLIDALTFMSTATTEAAMATTGTPCWSLS